MLIATLRHMFPFFGGHEIKNVMVDQIFKYSSWVIYALIFISFVYYLFHFMKKGGFVKEYLTSFVIGLLFGLGIIVSGVAKISKVLGFLTISKDWDPTILFAFLTAIFVDMIAFQLMMRGRPVYASDFKVYRNTRVTWKLVVGTLLFGLGAGLAGLSPGTAMVNFFILHNVVLFVVAMAVGQVLYDEYSKR